ncbi:FUSC family protein [Bacillus sp. RAR_GA_16]|uniref:FUSC family protein n=1 Tax=Bacillus sp. RAR_GA_16 TaxID=2876774 RepID=UPI001CCFF04B|nr:FUSC family protein [Bacillus sp. RAR_GA_16]MCA0170940.1 FUSC family protein [Bacillus sp. RAR_GA_16]
MLTKNKKTIIKSWWARLAAADPGRTRLHQAARITISVFSSVMFMLWVTSLLNISFTPAILAGVVSLLSLLLVNDDTDKKKKITALLLVISSMVWLTVRTYLSSIPFMTDGLFLLVIFFAYYLQHYGFRYFGIFMIAFLSIYFSTLLNLQPPDLPGFIIGIFVGGGFSYLYHFIFFKNKPKRQLSRSMNSFHIQTNLTLDLVLDAIADPTPNRYRALLLKRDVKKLNEYAQVISGQLTTTDPGEVWPGIDAEQLRMYVFDAEMLIETLYPAVKRIKELHALEHNEVRKLLYKLVESVRDAEVLRSHDIVGNLKQTENVIEELKQQLIELRVSNHQNKDWLWLIRRIESIANHLVDSSIELGERRIANIEEKERLEDAEEIKKENASTEEKSKQPRAATIKALQAIVAGAAAIILGNFLSPAHQYWVLLSAFVVLLGTDTVGMTLQKAFQRSLGTIFGAVAGFGLAHLLAGQVILELIALFCCIFMAFYLLSISYAMMMFWMTMLIAIMYDFLLGGITEQILMARVFDTLAGAILGFLAAAIIYPKSTREKVANTAEDFLSKLSSYVADYLDSFAERNKHYDFTNQAFSIDEQMRKITEDARPLRNRPAILARSGIERWLTVLTAINYFAKHLLASTNRNNRSTIVKGSEKTLDLVKEVIKHNILTVLRLLKGETGLMMYNLNKEREFIEGLSENIISDDQEVKKFVNDLYYIWRINQSLLLLGKELGVSKNREAASFDSYKKSPQEH